MKQIRSVSKNPIQEVRFKIKFQVSQFMFGTKRSFGTAFTDWWNKCSR